MVLTVKEAKKKWCPMSRIHPIVGPTGVEIYLNREYKGEHNNPRCMGADCMMWVWYRPSAGLGYCGFAKKAGWYIGGSTLAEVEE